MRKFAALLLTFAMTVSLAACAGNSEPAETSPPDTESSISAESTVPESNKNVSEQESEPATDNQTEETESPAGTDTESAGSQVLVVYFSATGTTEGVAENIADGLDADLYEIVPEEPYTDADLDYHDNNSRSTVEMNDPSSRPSISGSVENMEQYSIVFIGYPIWWGEAPRIVSTFMESYDFYGKTIVPFCTSGGSGIGSSASNLEKLTSGATWLDGQRLNGSDSQDTVMEWVNSLGLDFGA
ncbi:flavodoxin [Evtepia gabavorous]|uniref:flavodoxin n=1 Tax=Evtepia gabavorous TaxID=2211183 RepID=UPI003A8D4E8B